MKDLELVNKVEEMQELDMTAEQMQALTVNEAEGIDDVDYEYNGGDAGMYNSRIDDIHELKTLYLTLKQLSENDKDRYLNLVKLVPQKMFIQFQEIMKKVDILEQ